MQTQNANSPLEQIVEAVEQTVVNPTPEQIAADIQTAINLYLEFKKSLNGLHPTVLSVIKFLI